MTALDYIVLAGYFVVMASIGIVCMMKVKAQEDFFMGGRSFGKLLQTFAAFGAGTGSSDPVNTARTTFTSGWSGMWSIMSWLFVTPFYWIAGVWFRRMRHLTLGDWFVERYESKRLGVAYTIFGNIFYMVYIAMLFTAISKVAAPLIGDSFGSVSMEYVLVPIIAVVVIIYGVLGGISAAYWTDLIQGLCIILLSIVLIPFGLDALVEKYGDPATDGLMHGFHIMHERIPDSFFAIVGSGNSSEFPLHRILAVVVISLIGVVVMPHFIATGGGTAKSEFNARVGLVVGNLLKRFCTIGWALTAMIVLALMADNPTLATDPDKVWGIASMELLWPGLRGLMLACLLAALMSSADCYMLVCSGLVVRNVYAAYINEDAPEKQCLLIARVTGAVIIIGAVLMSWSLMDVFAQLQLTWIVPMLFAAPFWLGLYWRKATTAGAWATVCYAAAMFFVIPWIAPMIPGLNTSQTFSTMNDFVQTTVTREASPSDVAIRDAKIKAWYDATGLSPDAEPNVITAAEQEHGDLPRKLNLGDTVTTVTKSGGKSVFWTGGVTPINLNGQELVVTPKPVGDPVQVDEHTWVVTLRYPAGLTLQGSGNFNLDFLLYQMVGVDLTTKSNATLNAMELGPKIVTPFLVMIIVSLLTKRNSKEGLDKYYAKMKTPVDPDPETDRHILAAAIADPDALEHRKLFPGTDIEIQRPNAQDIIGFAVSVLACFAIIGLAMFVAGIGG